jgi:hypothetical protein
MPFIHIKTLKTAKAYKAPVTAIAKDFAKATGIGLEHITVSWELFDTLHGSTPVIVDLLAPDFNSRRTVFTMLHAVAESISKRTKVPLDQIFINYREARSGRVFDAGKVVRW